MYRVIDLDEIVLGTYSSLNEAIEAVNENSYAQWVEDQNGEIVFDKPRGIIYSAAPATQDVNQLKVEVKMEKVIRDNKVAVLISHGWGAGWYSWFNNQELLFSPKIVDMVEQNRANEIDEDWVKENLGLEDVYCGGASGLKIYWLPVGTAFAVDEYDGNESLRTLADLDIIA